MLRRCPLDRRPAPTVLECALEGCRDLHHPHDRVGPLRPHAGRVPLPRRHPPPHVGRREHPHPLRSRTGRGFAVLPQQLAPGLARLLAGDLLLEDRDEHHLEHLPSAQQPESRVAVQRVGEQRRGRDIQPGPVVAVAEQFGHTLDRPRRARAPRGDRHAARAAHEVHGRRAERRAQRAPDAVGLHPERGVGVPAPQRRQGAAQRHLALGCVDRRDRRGEGCRVGQGHASSVDAPADGSECLHRRIGRSRAVDPTQVAPQGRWRAYVH